MVTGDSQEEVIIFRDTQTDTSPLYIYHHYYYQHKRQGDNTGDYININLFEKERLLFSNKEEESNSIFKKLDTERNVAILIQIKYRIKDPKS